MNGTVPPLRVLQSVPPSNADVNRSAGSRRSALALGTLTPELSALSTGSAEGIDHRPLRSTET